MSSALVSVHGLKNDVYSCVALVLAHEFENETYSCVARLFWFMD